MPGGGVINTSAYHYDLEEMFSHESISFSLESKNNIPSGGGVGGGDSHTVLTCSHSPQRLPALFSFIVAGLLRAGGGGDKTSPHLSQHNYSYELSDVQDDIR